MRRYLSLAGLILLAVAAVPRDGEAMTPPPTATPTATPTPTLGEIAVVAVSANTSDGNLPANTIDNNLGTRWSGYGDGAWIRYELSGRPHLAAVRIGVYRGNERQNRFDLQVSDDGVNWTMLVPNMVTRVSAAEELYDFPDRPGTRYARYLGHGSTAGLWNSLTEVSWLTYRNEPTCTISASPAPAAVGQEVEVIARSNLGIGRWTLEISQDSANPVLTPAFPPAFNGSFTAGWKLQAERPGTVGFRVNVHGEIYEPSCSCYTFRSTSCSLAPFTVLGEPPRVTPTPTHTPLPTPTPTPTPPATVEIHLPGSAVSASTRDENVPANAVDNSLVTRWSGFGDGAWLKLDLGATRTVAYVNVATHRGNERRSRFDLQVSNDQATWTTVWSGESTGTTSAEETYEFADRPARYVRYLGHGNNDPAKAGWNSVNEISVFVVP